MSNLIPANQKASILKLYRKRFLSLAFLSVFLLSLVSILLLLPSLFFLKSNETVLAAKKQTLSSHETNTIAATLATSITNINKKLSVFPETETASPLLAQFINPVLKAKTNAVHIEDFSYTLGDKGADSKIQISGTTDSRADLLGFADKLKATSGFHNVDVPISSFIKDANVTFIITATVAMPK